MAKTIPCLGTQGELRFVEFVLSSEQEYLHMEKFHWLFLRPNSEVHMGQLLPKNFGLGILDDMVGFLAKDCITCQRYVRLHPKKKVKGMLERLN